MRQTLIKETVLLAMLQTAVIIFGVIWASAIEDGFSSMGQSEPRLLSILAHYGLMTLTIPLIWIAFVLFRERSASVNIKIATFCTGLILVAVSASFICFILVYSSSSLDLSPIWNQLQIFSA